MRMIAALALAGVLTGCATPQNRIVVQEVKVPVPVPCVAKIPEAPIYPDSDEAIKSAPDLFSLATLYRAGRGVRIAREAGLVEVLKSCGVNR
jgi:hypothetical protein